MIIKELRKPEVILDLNLEIRKRNQN